jgi:hypothetical protein
MPLGPVLTGGVAAGIWSYQRLADRMNKLTRAQFGFRNNPADEMVLAPETTRPRTNNILRNKIISIGRWRRLAWLHRPRSRWRRQARRRRIPREEAIFTQVAAGGGFRGRGFGFFGPYAYGGYPYYYGDDYEGGCYLVARRVLTRYGWRGRRVEICD